uniref:Uncharacterized protein n=1 Tax=Gouania willdenowi TaxID=441366 RepID=A0A8C5HYN0_GOUWI
MVFLKPYFSTVYGFQNNLAPTSPSVLTTSGANVSARYGVQKNISNGGAVLGSGVSTATRSQSDDAYRRDYKFSVSDKENVAGNKDTDRLILAKDSGKQFASSSSIHVGGGGKERQIYVINNCSRCRNKKLLP